MIAAVGKFLIDAANSRTKWIRSVGAIFDIRRRHRSVPSMLLVGVVIFGLLSGCGDANPLGRRAITGKVTLDGDPLQHGTIAFRPLADDGVGSGAVIANGTFSISASKGLPPGEYLVQIHAAGKETSVPDPDEPPGPAGPPAIELIPPGWNTQSEHTITVTGEGKNQYTFPIETPTN